MKVFHEGKILSNQVDKAFIETGYSNWKNAGRGFSNHHKAAHSALLPGTADVGELLSDVHSEQKKENRQFLMKIISNLRYLARQAEPFRGSKDDNNSNFIQSLKLRGEDDPLVLQWLMKKSSKFTSHDIQNEILRIMANSILRDIANSVRNNKHFTVMIDETSDISNKEQCVIVIRWVDDSLDVHEDFLGLYSIDNTESQTLVKGIKDVLLRMNLSVQNIRGQRYDGASVMKGHRTGVAKVISDLEPRAVYTHCYGHSLNLAVCDSVRACLNAKKYTGNRA